MTFDLNGRGAIITGASQGIGLAIAKAYVQAGADVVMCARQPDALEQAREEVAALARPGQIVDSVEADVTSAEHVERLVSESLGILSRIHILVNNAGVYGPKGRIEDVDWQEWVRAIDINLFGSVLSSRAILKHFRHHRYGKIVQLSGGGATNPMMNLSAYAASKAAVVRFAETLALEVADDNITVNCIAPGAVNTRMLQEIIDAGPEKVGQQYYQRSLEQAKKGGVPPETGAALAVYLGSAASDGITGRLIAAVWDPWETLADHAEEIRKSDVYTLRRIVPKDRGFGWGDR